MADDLSLAIILKTILDADGFDEAQKKLKEFAGAANGAGEQTRRAGERVGGARGPVADLTRVLLVNIGVMHGAGEAAKFAGVALTAMETAAAGASLALVGATAGIALAVPIISEWISQTKNQTDEQEELNKKLRDIVPDLERYASGLKVVNESLALQLAADRGAKLRAERAELAKLREEAGPLRERLQEAFDGATKGGRALNKEFSTATERLALIEGRITDLTAAQNAGRTVEEMYLERTKEQTTAFDAQKKSIKDVEEELDRLAERDLQTANERIQAGADRAAQDEEQSRDAIRDINAFGRAQQAATKKAMELDSDLTSARTENTRLQQQAEAELAQARIDAEIMVSEASLGALAAFFPKQKAFAIAQALIDMYAGANKALGQGGFFGIAMAAAVIANGLANVANIRKQEVGFDDPFNDLLAEKLGRKSAADFVRYFGIGFQGGMASAGVTNNYQTTQVTNNNGMSVGSFHSHAIIGAKRTQQLVDLNRELKQIDRRIERRTRIGG